MGLLKWMKRKIGASSVVDDCSRTAAMQQQQQQQSVSCSSFGRGRGRGKSLLKQTKSMEHSTTSTSIANSSYNHGLNATADETTASSCSSSVDPGAAWRVENILPDGAPRASDWWSEMEDDEDDDDDEAGLSTSSSYDVDDALDPSASSAYSYSYSGSYDESATGTSLYSDEMIEAATSNDYSFDDDDDDSDASSFQSSQRPRRFRNCGLETWVQVRQAWRGGERSSSKPCAQRSRLLPLLSKPARRELVKALVDCRKFDLNHRMSLADVIKTYNEIWYEQDSE